MLPEQLSGCFRNQCPDTPEFAPMNAGNWLFLIPFLSPYNFSDILDFLHITYIFSFSRQSGEKEGGRGEGIFARMFAWWAQQIRNTREIFYLPELVLFPKQFFN